MTNILSNLFNILISILNFIFGYNINNPIFSVMLLFVVGVTVLGVLRYLIKGL